MEHRICIRCGSRLRLIPPSEGDKWENQDSPHPKTVEISHREIAKYPFLSEARRVARGLDGKSLTGVVINRAVSRLKKANDGLFDRWFSEDGNIELLTFLAEVHIVKLAGVDALTRRFALAEARRTEYFLQVELRKDVSRAVALACHFIEHELGLRIRETDAPGKNYVVKFGQTRFYVTPLLDYMMYTGAIWSKEWSIVYQIIEDGKVYLRTEQLAQLVRHLLQIAIILRIKTMPVPALTGFPKDLVESVEDFRRIHPIKARLGKQVNPGISPPCIRRIIEMLRRGDNVPHPERVLLATYLSAIGHSTDDICDFFKNAANYNEKTTRYQVEYLGGKNPQGHPYQVKTCQRIKSDGLCYPDDGCGGITHPRQYGTKKNDAEQQIK